MQLTYDDWYERTAAMLIASDLPEAFVEDCLTNRVLIPVTVPDTFPASLTTVRITR